MFFKVPTSVLYLTFASVLIVSLYSTPALAKPWDLYDDVSAFFDTMSLDDVPGAKDANQMEPKEFCRMPARKGVCRALIPRWSYDANKKDCVEFKFGGCDGNENNFPSYKACMSTCQGM
ncbi:kunitz/BPTI-like toxin [Lucilia sericata]|uniref:kunitz/BPTI-like toxin n=1 Tax=Lucilia sericata TaxID=13632 RepID=UPI0018A7E9A3|nr:kunitz/BPTI-like toxin [Lucilia sericata]